MSSYRIDSKHLCIYCRRPAAILVWSGKEVRDPVTGLLSVCKVGPYCGSCANERNPYIPPTIVKKQTLVQRFLSLFKRKKK